MKGVILVAKSLVRFIPVELRGVPFTSSDAKPSNLRSRDPRNP